MTRVGQSKQQQVLAVALLYKMFSITFCRYNVKLPHWLNFLRSQACRIFVSHSQTTRDFIKNPERFPHGLAFSPDCPGVSGKGKNSRQSKKGALSAAAASASHLSSGGPTTFTLAERQRSVVEAAAAALEEEEESSEEEEEEERPRKKKKKKKSSTAAAASAAADGE
jgi:hypothetical protein